jgi:hypothetical protein
MVSKNVKVKIQVELKLFVSDVKSENVSETSRIVLHQ